MESSHPGCGSLTDLPPRSTPELEALRDLDWVNGRFLPRGTGQRNSTAWEEALVGMGIGRGCAGQGLLRWEEFNLESTWRTLQQQMLQSGGFLVFVTAVNLLLLKAYKLNRWRVPRLFNVPSLEILLGLMLLQGITQSAAGSMGTAAAGGGRQALAGLFIWLAIPAALVIGMWLYIKRKVVDQEVVVYRDFLEVLPLRSGKELRAAIKVGTRKRLVPRARHRGCVPCPCRASSD